MKLVSILKNSYYWVKALQCAAREQYIDAEKYIKKITRRDYEIWTLSAFIYFALNDDEKAIYSSKEAKKLITKSSISEVDRSYVMAYLSDLEYKIKDSAKFKGSEPFKSLEVALIRDKGDATLLSVIEFDLFDLLKL